MSLWTAIDTRLTGDATLIALLAAAGKGIYYGRIPALTGMPGINYWAVGGTPPDLNAPFQSGSPYTETIQIQFDVWATDPGVANTIAKRLRVLLAPQSLLTVDDGTNISLVPTSPVDHVILESEDGDESETVDDVWHVPCLYEAILQKTF